MHKKLVFVGTSILECILKLSQDEIIRLLAPFCNQLIGCIVSPPWGDSFAPTGGFSSYEWSERSKEGAQSVQTARDTMVSILRSDYDNTGCTYTTEGWA